MSYNKNELEAKTVSELLIVAKELHISGRYDMNKARLIDAIIEKTDIEACIVAKSGKADEVWEDAPISQPVHFKKQDYLDKIQVGSIVAFTISQGMKMLSGKVTEIRKSRVIITTRLGVTFNVKKECIVWHKTRDTWPKGIYEALRGNKPLTCPATNENN